MASSSQAFLHPDDLAAWVAGREAPASYHQTSTPTALSPLKLFSLNDYLGLASHPDVCSAASQVVLQYGMGPRSSALVGGYTSYHRELEQGLAGLKGTEECLLFPTGFAANMGTLAALAGSEDVAIYSDELNHASIIDGARLATRNTPPSVSSSSGSSSGNSSSGGNRLHIYRHNDLAHLEQLLRAAPPRQRRLVVTDSLFSMDGDFADLPGLAALKARHDFLLMVDEAHATLVCGEHGGGAAEAMGVAHHVDVHVGTLSKAFGALGGFVATSRAIKAYLLNRSRPFVYSTSLPLPVVAAASAALHVSQRESWRRRHVWALTTELSARLRVPALSPVIPLVIGSEEATLQLSSRLLAAGLHVPAIRPPTVPAGTCRLRVSLSSALSHGDVAQLADLVLASGATLQHLPHLVAQKRSGVAECCRADTSRP
ncbi:MAG: hypothetical protein WDW38_004877 [Sanguina aurantia]